MKPLGIANSIPVSDTRAILVPVSTVMQSAAGLEALLQSGSDQTWTIESTKQ